MNCLVCHRSGDMLDLSTLQLLCEPFGLLAERASFVARSQNDVYAFDGSVLRISHGRGQTQELVENELSWIDDLSARGLPVCRRRVFHARAGGANVWSWTMIRRRPLRPRTRPQGYSAGC